MNQRWECRTWVILALCIFWFTFRFRPNVTWEDDEGVLHEDPEEIREIYVKHFEKLLQRPTSESTEGKEAEVIAELVERGMEILARKIPPQKTSIEEVKQVVNKLNERKARDSQTWSNADIKNGGNEMVESLQRIFQKMDNELDITDEWEEMDIIALHKKGLRRKMDNKRGIFLTNNIGKIYEKVIKGRNSEPFESNITKWVTGGVKKRSPIDNTMIATTMIERNNYLGKNTYLTFTDAQKCFDKLWLEDGINELWRLGTNARDCIMIKNLKRMNEVAKIVVKTPLGPTRQIVVKKIVKQGTVYGPQICISSMDKINLLGNDVVTYYGPDIPIRAVSFIDDVTGMGGITTSNSVITNCGVMEEQKKFSFSNSDGKTEYLVVVCNEEEIKTVTSEVRQGPIKRVFEHKMLGTWFDETGRFEINIIKRKEKLPFMIGTVIGVGSSINVGYLAVQVRLKLGEVVVLPSFLYNAEGFAVYTTKEINELEKVQGNMLRKFLAVPRSTHYDLLMETGILNSNPSSFLHDMRRL